MDMRAINFSEARSNLKAVFDRVVEDADVTIITRRDAEDVVVMSLAEWNSWQETEYLAASPANARRLDESLAQARAGKTQPRALVQAGTVHEEPARYKARAGETRRAPPRPKRR